MLKLQRLHLLSIAALLAISATFLPGGLLPHVQHLNHVAAAATSRQSPRIIVSQRKVIADLRVDSAGMLLHPQCDATNHSFAATSFALIRVQCMGGRINTTRGPGGRFGALGLPIATAGRDTHKLFCGDSERAQVALQCLPVLVRALREFEPIVYSKYVAPRWLKAARLGLPFCCSEAENQKPLAFVNLTQCGLPCHATVPPAKIIANDSASDITTSNPLVSKRHRR